ncbi:MAG: disulfide bond formation protein B [Bauldia sp.]
MNTDRLRDARIPAFVFALGLAAILSAWGFQLIGGYVPCKLCLEQRIPYYVGLPIALAALGAALAGAPARTSRLLLAIAGLVFCVSVYLATYHAGIEWGWWAGPADCGAGGAGATLTTDDLANQLKGIRVVSCSQASFRFLGLSFAGWNAVVSVVLVAGSFYGVLRGDRDT